MLKAGQLRLQSHANIKCLLLLGSCACMQQSVDQRCKQLNNMIMICDMHGGHVCKKIMSIGILLISSSLLKPIISSMQLEQA